MATMSHLVDIGSGHPVILSRSCEFLPSLLCFQITRLMMYFFPYSFIALASGPCPVELGSGKAFTRGTMSSTGRAGK